MAKKRAKPKPDTHTPQTSFRLPEAQKVKLRRLSEKHMGASKTKVLIRAIDELFDREFPPPRKKSEESA